ncbi:MAG: thiol:disulfide interchange protein DsbA/DsbL [Duodenibacillus sp.]|nr:thiol:disulfide interchange protein DsbA/DsbL [Duodenibacillus sp.]
MTSRRILVAAAAALPFASAPALAEPAAGKDYVALHEPLPFDPSPVYVHDFFAYTCPHCLQFAPSMEEYAKSVAGNDRIRIVPVPVAWSPKYEIFPRAYFAFEALGRLKDLHLPFWEYVLRDEHDWPDAASMMRDVEAWAGKRGIDAETWNRTVRSFQVSGRSRRSELLWKSYQIDSTPSVGVGGRYVTSPEMTVTRGACIETVEFLVNRLLKG